MLVPSVRLFGVAVRLALLMTTVPPLFTKAGSLMPGTSGMTQLLAVNQSPLAEGDTPQLLSSASALWADRIKLATLVAREMTCVRRLTFSRIWITPTALYALVGKLNCGGNDTRCGQQMPKSCANLFAFAA